MGENLASLGITIERICTRARQSKEFHGLLFGINNPIMGNSKTRIDLSFSHLEGGEVYMTPAGEVGLGQAPDLGFHRGTRNSKTPHRVAADNHYRCKLDQNCSIGVPSRGGFQLTQQYAHRKV